MKMSLRFGTPTLAVRDIGSRAVEIRIGGDESKPFPNFDYSSQAWDEFRRLVLVFAFENRDVTLLVHPESSVLRSLGVSVPSVRSSILHRVIEAVVPGLFTRANRTASVGEIPDSSIASPADLGHRPDRIIALPNGELAIRWKSCAADTLSEIAYDGDFETGAFLLTTLGDSVAERYADLYRYPDSGPDSIPATADEAFYCTGDSDGTVMRWLNPSIPKTEIVDRLKMMCKIFSWKCRVSDGFNSS